MHDSGRSFVANGDIPLGRAPQDEYNSSKFGLEISSSVGVSGQLTNDMADNGNSLVADANAIDDEQSDDNGNESYESNSVGGKCLVISESLQNCYEN